MSKLFFQAAWSLTLFFGTWYLLSQINYTGYFNLSQIGEENEQKLGDMIFDAIRENRDIIESDSVEAIIDKIKERICVPNGIDADIDIQVIEGHEANAFALPGDRMLVLSGLIGMCKTPEEFAGVLCHEIAHMEREHVMQKMIKEVGLAMLATMAGGNSSPEILKEIVRLFSSSAFDRKQEREADAAAVAYMAKAGLDPEHFANLLFRFSHDAPGVPSQLQWISTHPDSKDRAAEVLELRGKEAFTVSALLEDAEWKVLKEMAE